MVLLEYCGLMATMINFIVYLKFSNISGATESVEGTPDMKLTTQEYILIKCCLPTIPIYAKKNRIIPISIISKQY